MTPPTQNERTFSGITVGSIWQRFKDGKHYEVVWGHDGWRDCFTGDVREPAVQLRVAGAQNLKNTHWVQIANMPKLYRRV